jgi:hypothetical protein
LNRTLHVLGRCCTTYEPAFGPWNLVFISTSLIRSVRDSGDTLAYKTKPGRGSVTSIKWHQPPWPSVVSRSFPAPPPHVYLPPDLQLVPIFATFHCHQMPQPSK